MLRSFDSAQDSARTGVPIRESFFPFTLSLSKPVLSHVEGGERLWIILNWKPYEVGGGHLGKQAALLFPLAGR